MIITPSSEFIRPANTTAYVAGDLVANSTTAAAVVPLCFNIEAFKKRSGVVGFVRLFKDDETTTNANFSLHLFTKAPSVTAGDNAAIAISTSEYWFGTVACDMSSGAFATSTDLISRFQTLHGSTPGLFAFDVHNNEVPKELYGLLEAEAAYTPSSGERFKVWLEIGDDGGNSQ